MKPVSIVAIGFSEGGIPPLHTFFDHTPLDATAYVVLGHLRPDTRSELQAILQRHSRLHIMEATTNTIVQSNTVYVLEENEYLKVVKNRLIVMPKEGSENNTSVDMFFTALAKNNESKIAGVILSGTGKDGTAGARAIKSAKGLVIVQTPADCAEGSMPASVINAGYADYISEVSLMPELLVRWTENHFLPVPVQYGSPLIDVAHRKLSLVNLGLSIKQHRIGQGITQAELGARLGMQKATISRIETGKNNVALFSLHRIAEALGGKIQDLF